MARRAKMAVELISDIGQRAADLANFYPDKEVLAALRYLVNVNPEAYRYLRDRLIEATAAVDNTCIVE